MSGRDEQKIHELGGFCLPSIQLAHLFMHALTCPKCQTRYVYLASQTGL